MLDNIQKQVERSVGYVKGGTEALVDAKKLQKNTRKVCACSTACHVVQATGYFDQIPPSRHLLKYISCVLITLPCLYTACTPPPPATLS